MLSQELLEIGKKANPKSNLSQATQAEIMHKMLTEDLGSVNDVGVEMKRLYNITKLVCNQLNKLGFPWYRVENFFGK